jgi:hypothetical protein
MSDGKEPELVSALGAGDSEQAEPWALEENAKVEVDKFLQYYRIDVTGQDENTQAVRLASEKLVKAVMEGRLKFEMRDGDMWVIQKLIKPLGNRMELEYRELDGKAKLQMKHNIDTDTHGKIQSLMGGLCKLGGAVLSNLKSVDLSTMESIGLVFLLA